MTQRVTHAVRPPTGPRWGRHLPRVVALAAITLAGAGCGLWSSSDMSGGSDGEPESDLSSAEVAMCEFGAAAAIVDATSLEEVLTGDTPDHQAALTALGLFVGSRDEVVNALGQYQPGARAIYRRSEMLMARFEASPSDGEVAIPDAGATDTELASVRAADRFLAERRCPGGGER
jgi:hypothetical protein